MQKKGLKEKSIEFLRMVFIRLQKELSSLTGPEDGIHKAAERIKLLNKTAPFQLLLFLQTTLGERISLSCSPLFP